jgi:5-methylcytosine-specific restriction endonuclease McrA
VGVLEFPATPRKTPTSTKEVLILDGNADAPFGRNNPFEEDFLVPPYSDELRERAEANREDNEEAVRHMVERILWETWDDVMYDPELQKEIVIPFLYLKEDVKLSWIAETCFLGVRQVCEIVEAHLKLTYHCLYCGEVLRIKSRQHLFRLRDSLDAYCLGGSEDSIADLLCDTPCAENHVQHEEDQKRLQNIHQKAQHDALREVDYGDRRQTDAWKRQIRGIVLARAGHKCTDCGRNDRILEIHHNTYRNYGQEKLEDFTVLCRPCHSEWHKRWGLPRAS